VNVEEYVDLATLNFRIDNFRWDSIESGNAVTTIHAKHIQRRKLMMPGSKMLCFVRYFGYIIGDYVPHGAPVGEFYLCLRAIVSIVFAPFVVREQMTYLSMLIMEHHEMYLKLFNSPLKFKHHMWLHYPDLMLQLGPMSKLSSLSLERHHRPSTHMARSINSRVNLTKTVMYKLQLQLCARLRSRKGLTFSLVGPTVCLHVEHLENYQLSSLFITNILLFNILHIITYFLCRGPRFTVHGTSNKWLFS